MTEQNCNPIAPQALPISHKSLISFEYLYILRRKVLESIFITLPPEQQPYRPGGNLFRHPIQVVVLGITEDEVKLGVFAHPDLVFEQGPKPDRKWQQRWEAEWDHPSRKSITPG